MKPAAKRLSVALATRWGRSGAVTAWARAHQRFPWLWPYGWLFLLITVVLYPAWTMTGGLFVAGDALVNYYPWFVLWRDQLGNGELPLWNPYTFSGSPAFAAPHAAYGYPVTWLLTPLPAEMAVNWFIGLHIVIAGMGTAWAAGKLGASRDGRFLAGFVFALGGVMAARLVSAHIFFIAGMAWFPIATGMAVTVNQRYRVPSLAAITGLLALSAQPEMLIFASWWLPVWAGVMALQEGRRRALVAVGRTVFAICLGIGLAMFFLLPVAEYQSVANRAIELPWDFRTAISMPPWHALTLVNPDVFGGPESGDYWPGPVYEWHEYLLYIGLVPLAIAGFARGRAAWVCFGLAVFTVLLGLGRHFPLYGLIDFLPGYDAFRNPPKHLLLAGFALALAAGLGISRVDRRALTVAATAGACLLFVGALTAEGWLPRFIDVLGGPGEDATAADAAGIAAAARSPLLLSSCVLAALALVAFLSGRWLRPALIGLALIELAVVLHPYWSEPSDPEVIAREVEALGGDIPVAATGEAAFLGNYGPVARVRQPSGYTSQFSAGYMELIAGFVNPSVVLTVDSRDARLLYLLGYEAVTERGSGLVEVFDPPPPQAWVARCSRPGGAVEVREPDFPLTSCVTRFDAIAEDPIVPPGAASVLEEGTRSLMVAAEGSGWLVTTIPWYPGWSVRIDGVSAPVEVLDGALVGVELPPGKHVVTFSYWPAGLTFGLLISGLSLLILVGLVILEAGNDPWTRFGLEPADGVVADEADEDGEEEHPEHDRGQPRPP